MKILFKRILRNGWQHFSRSPGLSWVVVFVMFLAISLALSVFLFRGAADFVMDSLEKKFDISVYFQEDALEDEILKTKEMLLELPGVKAVEYISAERALENFRERHQYNDLVTQALDEVEENPFWASLNIRASSPTAYESVNDFLQGPRFDGLVEQIDYLQRKPVIDAFYSLTTNLQKTGLISGLILAFIALVIAFTTVRLAIYSAADEIVIMRLVGASNWFIRGPFLVQGMICGLLAVIFALVFFGGLSYFLNERVFGLTGGFELFRYFINNALQIFGLAVAVGAGLGTISSAAAVGRYLEK